MHSLKVESPRAKTQQSLEKKNKLWLIEPRPPVSNDGRDGKTNEADKVGNENMQIEMETRHDMLCMHIDLLWERER